MVETITATASPALDHIIERPRLIARLEEGGGARVSVLAAPAGYGKTTLARQWSQRQSGPVAWYRTTRASGDVALLAVQLDELLASLAPELPREPEKVATIASVNPSPQPLGRALLRTFAKLSRDVLLVVDEWEAAGSEEAEELLSMLVEGLDIRFLLTTRTRPDWFTPRLEVYGEGLEIGVDELAMTDEEANEGADFRWRYRGPSTRDAHRRGLARRPGTRGDERRRRLHVQPPPLAHTLRVPCKRAPRRRRSGDAGRADVACGGEHHRRRRRTRRVGPQRQ